MSVSTRRRIGVGALVLAGAGAALVGAAGPAGAADRVDLSSAARFAVLAGTTVTNGAVGGSSTTRISGDVGVSPGSAVTGLTATMVTNGTVHHNDATAIAAQSGLTIAYNEAANPPPRSGAQTLGGRRLTAGVVGGTTVALTGTVTLDAQGDPAAVFVIQATSSLKIAATGTVKLVNAAQACHVYWQVGSSATLGANAVFKGSVLAQRSITVGADADVQGRLLARTGSVTLIDDRITRPACTTGGGGTSSSPSSTTGSTGATGSGTASGGPSTGSTGPGASSSTSGRGAGSTGPGAGPTGTAGSGAGGTGALRAAPVVTTVGPVSGPTSGGTTVTVGGSGFVSGATGVTVGGVPVPAGDIHVLSSTRLTFVTPAHSAGPAVVQVTTSAGASSTGLSFTYGGGTGLASTGAPNPKLAVGISLLLVLGGALVLILARRPQPVGRHR